MTALEYMEKQLQKHRHNYEMGKSRGIPQDQLENIGLKIGYYEAAIKALKNEEER